MEDSQETTLPVAGEPLSAEWHLENVRRAANDFLASIGAASEAGVSQAQILPMLVELMRDSGISLDPGSLMSALG